MEDFSTPVSLAISSTLYGLVYFLAWSGRFPTSLERLLWRVSSSGLVQVFTQLILNWMDSAINRRRSLIIVLVEPSAHFVASGFLILESLRQLFFLDDAAYQVPYWSNYWPHFS